MDCQSTNIMEICEDLAKLSNSSIKSIDKCLEQQTLRLDVLFDELLQTALRQKRMDSVDYVPEKKMSKRTSSKGIFVSVQESKNDQVGDLFADGPNFQQPAVPPIRRTRRQASIAAVDKMKNVRESQTISSGATTRASRARALSTFMDVSSIDCPKANSTFVVKKNCLENVEECLSPQMFSPVKSNETYIKPNNSDKTNSMASTSKTNVTKKLSKNINLLPEEPSPIKSNSNITTNKSSTKATTKKKGEDSQIKEKKREKLEDIDVNVEEKKSQHMTRTMKRKLQEDNPIDAKLTNVIHVPLEKQVSTPLKPVDDLLQTPHQIRENEAEKRKELYLKSKADQRKFDDQHMKAAKQREEQMKRIEEKIKKTAEEKKKKEEKQKEKELLMKEEALKKQKQAELRLAEINAKRKLAEEAKMLKVQKAEMERKLKENEMKKKNELKSEKSKSVRPKVGTSNASSLTTPKVVTLPKTKIEKTTASNKNDYGLNDVSARDSSEDESGPKKTVPSWAKRENRKAVLELQYHVDSVERDLFFDCPKSMSLKEMFKGWNIRDRQRTSSAVWNTPPRYSEYLRRY